MNVEDAVVKKRNSLKTDRLDMSFGELMNMFEDGDLFITPEYQRAFRWSEYQQTRFVESVLLGIPIPPIFVAEDDDGKWEVVDGLQRMSTIFAFFGMLDQCPEKNNSILTAGEMVKELEGLNIETLPLKLKTTIKRSVCRVEIVRWDSTEDIRYELFNRLNTGACPLSEQEIRNCIFRSYKVDFNMVLRRVAATEEFEALINPTESKKEVRFLEELALRFFAFKNVGFDSKSTVPQFLTEFMRDVSNGEYPLNLKKEEEFFSSFIHLFYSQFGKQVFRPKGVFALHLFDSIAYALPRSFAEINEENHERIVKCVDLLLNDEAYNTIGTTTFSNQRVKARMARALEVFANASSD